MGNSPRLAHPDPRKGVRSPVRYHTGDGGPADDPSGPHPAPADEPPAAGSGVWRKVRQNLLFWRAATDVVRVSVFGPPAAVPGQPARVSVYLHTDGAADSVRTLSRAFHHDSELIGTGYLGAEVARGAELSVHLSVANAGVTRSVVALVWRGQPHRLGFDLHVPWEAPGGPAPGAVSVGRGGVRIGRAEFRLNLLPRKG